MATLLARGFREGGLLGRRCARRHRRVVACDRGRLRRDRPRRDAAGHQRPRRVPSTARVGPLGAGPAPHRSRRGGRSRPRSRRGCGRLPDEAVQLRRVGRPRARPRAPTDGRATDGARGREPARRPGSPPGVAWRRRGAAVAEGDGAARVADATRRRGRHTDRHPRPRLGLRLRRHVERRRPVRRVPAAEGRSPVRSRRHRNGARRRLSAPRATAG